MCRHEMKIAELKKRPQFNIQYFHHWYHLKCSRKETSNPDAHESLPVQMQFQQDDANLNEDTTKGNITSFLEVDSESCNDDNLLVSQSNNGSWDNDNLPLSQVEQTATTSKPKNYTIQQIMVRARSLAQLTAKTNYQLQCIQH